MQTGKYELISRLAIGGMAEVFLARAAGPMGFEKTLVVKRILSHLAEDPAFVEMFLSEARLAARLNHPNIVQIFDFGEADGEYFLAMEYIDGPNLRALLKKAAVLGMQLPPALCARIIASACEGLAFAHELQDPATGEPLWLIHRDISTDNILVSRQGAVKLVDFGIAKAAGQDHRTHTGVIKGKVSYLAPEQIRGKTLDLRVDVYALGIVLYELLTGRKPFNARTDPSLMQAILFEPLVPASQYRPDVPEALQRILDRALAKDREERYPNCRAFQIDLEDFILSTGKAVGAWQLSQLVTQLAPPPASMLPSVARHTEEPPTRPALTTPAPSPAPRLPTNHSRPVERGTPPPRRAEAPTQPMLPAVQSESVDTLPCLAPASPPPDPKPHAVRAKPALKWLPALMGVAVLIAGGGYIAGTSTKATNPDSVPSIASPGATAVAQAITPSSEKPLEPDDLSVSETPRTEAVLDDEPRPAPKMPSESAARASPSRANRETRPAAATSRTGMLRLVVRGWAEIWVDGKKKGRVPPINEMELPAGRHQLMLINPSLKPYRATVTIVAGETLEHRVLFQAAEDTQASVFGKVEPTRLTNSAH